MSSLGVDVHVAEGVVSPVAEDELAAAVRFVLEREGVAEAEISVTLLPDAEIARLNREYLGHEGPTDVISFPLEGPGERVVGDVYVGAEQARRQAEELGAPLREEVLRLAMHGCLHVLGHDHPEGEDRANSEMYLRQEALLAAFLAGEAGR